MQNFLYKIKDDLTFFVLLILALVLTVIPSVSNSVSDGLRMFVVCILPSAFPYFFITATLTHLSLTKKISYKLSPLFNKVFKVNGSVGYAFFMSILAGYPTGAKIVSDLKNDGVLSHVESVRASVLCSSSSPVFLIGTVGIAIFNSAKLGVLLFLTNFLATITVGLIFSNYKKSISSNFNSPLKTLKDVDLSFSDGVYSAVTSTLLVGGIITLFYTFIDVLLKLKILLPFISFFNLIFKNFEVSKSLTLGLIESTRGIREISSLPISNFTLPLLSLFVSFGGICVIIQSVAFLKNAKIKIAPFLLGKVLTAILSIVYSIIFTAIFF